MKKILIACRSYFPDVMGGGELSTKSLAENLKAQGFDVHVFAISDTFKDEQINNVTIHRVKQFNVYWSYKGKSENKIKKIMWHILDSNNFFGVKSIEKILEDIKPDILITSTIEDVSSIIWKIAHKKNIKVIHILRSYSLLCTNANMYKKENCTHQCNSCSIISKPKKINSQYVDIVVGISDYILKKHKNLGYFQKAKEKVIYNICSDIQLIQKEEKKAEDDRLKIGYLGRIHETKGIDLIFDSLRHFSDEDKGKISLRIAGNGDDKYLSFLSKIAQKNNIETLFVGSVNQYDFLNRIDLLIVPSKWQEPFGRVIVESIMSSVPVLVSNKGGMPELLEENPDFIFNDAHELSDKISKFIKNELVFNFQINRFLTEKIMNDWHDLINQ